MDDNYLSGETYCTLKKLIETLTHSGLKNLDESLFKELKTICKTSPTCIKEAYSLTLHQMKKKHSEIRLLAFQICIELFKRSALFRELVVKDLQVIFELTAETNSKKKLPPPKAAAKSLEMLALSTIKKWNDDFGDSYKELQIAYNFFKHSKKVNFQNMIVINEAEERRQRKENELKMEKIRRLNEDIDNNESDIDNAITILTNCMSLLIPSLDNFFISDIDKTEDSETGNQVDCAPKQNFLESSCDNDKELNLKHFGVMKNYSLTVPSVASGSKIRVEKTDENSSIVQNAEDNMKLIKNRYLPLVKKWNQTCVKFSADNGSTVQRILKIKEKLEKCIEKYRQLNIEDVNVNESDSSDEDLEEVQKEGYEVSAPDIEEFQWNSSCSFITKPKEPVGGWKISVGDDGDPTSAVSTLKRLQEKTNIPEPDPGSNYYGKSDLSKSGKETEPSSEVSRKSKLLASAPKLPYDIDLYHWEDQNLTAPTLLSVKLDNPKFWGTSTIDDMDEIPNPEGIAALRTRVIEFSGKFEPVKWSCRAPLPNGKLCPRKDRFKCPFHGKIVPRNESGVCEAVNEDIPSTSFDASSNKTPDWQDPELLEDIKNATGVDLSIPKKGKRKAKQKMNKTHKCMKTSSSTLQEIERRKFPGLTDIIGKQNTTYNRISKKIFKRSSLNKVAATLNKIDFIKHRDKFGDQFNYVYGT